MLLLLVEEVLVEVLPLPLLPLPVGAGAGGVVPAAAGAAGAAGCCWVLLQTPIEVCCVKPAATLLDA
jgi:hypothetical protein